MYLNKICTSLVSAALVFSAGCSGGSSGSSDAPAASDKKGMSNLPSSMSVDIPESLGIQTNPYASILTVGLKSSVMKDSPAAPMSFAYSNVNGSISIMKTQLSSMAMNVVMVDRAIDGLSASDEVVKGKTINITQNLIDTILSILPENERAAQAERFKKDDFTGKSMPLGDFVYQTTADPIYKYKYSETNAGGSFSVYWSEDKNIMKIVSVSEGYTYGIVRNISDNSSKMYVICSLDASQSPTGEAMEYTSISSMKEVPDSQKHGVFLSETYLSNKNGIVSSFTFEGVADDDGGYIVNSVVDLYSTAVIPQKTNYIEGFDKTGNLTFQQNGAFVAYGESPAAYKALYDEGIASIGSMQGTCNNDTAITGNNADTIFKDASWAADGEVYAVFDSNTAEVTGAITGYNTDMSNASKYMDILLPHVVGVAICDKSGSVSIYITNQTVYAGAASLCLSKVDYANSALGDIEILEK